MRLIISLITIQFSFKNAPEDCETAANEEDDDEELATAPIPQTLLAASLS